MHNERKISQNKLLITAIITILLSSSIIVYWLRDVLMPFFIGAVIAYSLTPLKNYLRKNLPMPIANLAPLISLLLLILVISALVIFIFPVLYKQLLSLYNTIRSVDIDNLQKLFNINSSESTFTPYINNILDKALLAIPDQILSFSTSILEKILTSTGLAVNFAMFTILSPFTAFYLLKDGGILYNKFCKLIPNSYKKVIRRIINEINNVLLIYVQGQLYISLILSIFYGISLLALGVDSPFTLGLIAGILGFIPYLGSIITLTLASILTYLQFLSLFKVLMVCAIFIIGHLFEMLLLSPKILGNKLGLHPLLTVLSLIISAKILGVIGMFLALPLTVLIMMIIKLLIVKYEKKLLSF